VRVRIHRGTREIGGTCIELESAGSRILLDLGLPLDAADLASTPLPDVEGLREGGAGLLAIVLSHGHRDHWGLIPKVNPEIPLVMGKATESIIRAAADFVPDAVKLNAAQYLEHGNSIRKRARALGGQVRLVLNQPGHNRPSTEDQSETRFETIIKNPGGHSERDLEMALEVSDAFRKELALEKVMRQWPVGLFKERVAGTERIFSGGKSAIDLIGIRKETLVLVELKADGNDKVGALSELLFYSSMMRDARKGIFEFDEESLAGTSAITRVDIMGCSNICAVLLAPSIHPLLRDPEIMAQLNLATKCHWADLPVRFETLRMAAKPTKRGEDFVFAQAS